MPHDNAALVALLREIVSVVPDIDRYAARYHNQNHGAGRHCDCVKRGQRLESLLDAARAAADALAAGGEAMVSRYTIGNVDDRDTMHRVIQVEYAGRGKWAVRRLGDCLNRDGEWEWEPLPSSRDDDFLTRCRYDNAPEAINAARRAEEPRHEVP